MGNPSFLLLLGGFVLACATTTVLRFNGQSAYVDVHACTGDPACPFCYYFILNANADETTLGDVPLNLNAIVYGYDCNNAGVYYTFSGAIAPNGLQLNPGNRNSTLTMSNIVLSPDTENPTTLSMNLVFVPRAGRTADCNCHDRTFGIIGVVRVQATTHTQETDTRVVGTASLGAVSLTIADDSSNYGGFSTHGETEIAITKP